MATKKSKKNQIQSFFLEGTPWQFGPSDLGNRGADAVPEPGRRQDTGDRDFPSYIRG